MLAYSFTCELVFYPGRGRPSRCRLLQPAVPLIQLRCVRSLSSKKRNECSPKALSLPRIIAAPAPSVPCQFWFWQFGFFILHLFIHGDV